MLPFWSPFPLPTIVSLSGGPGPTGTKRREGEEEKERKRQDEEGEGTQIFLVLQIKAGFCMLKLSSQIVVDQKSWSSLPWKGWEKECGE